MKKVGIITMHYANNYGAVLQCYALRKMLNSFDNTRADVLNFISAKHPRLPVYEDFAINKLNLERAKLFDNFREDSIQIIAPPFSELTPETYGEYDYFIAGSDQIWNPRFTLRDFYFLDFAPEKFVKIAYAPSIARSVADISKSDIETFKKHIPRFDYLSVREKTHEQFIQQFTDKKVSTVLDPTMLLTAADYEEIITAPVENEKYILLYFLNHDFSAPAILSFANRISRKFNLKVKHSFVEIPPNTFKNNAESFRFNTGPKEFLGLIKNAEMVVTNSFHGTVFSIIFGKPFYSFVVKSMSARMNDLLGEFGLEKRIVDGYKPDKNIDLNVDFSYAHDKLEELRKNSTAFLKNALK